jgi:hypothetical protein
MHTYRDGASGNYCWTKDAAASTSDSDNTGWGLSTTLVECGGPGGTAGTYVETLDQFDVGDILQAQFQSLAARYLQI